MVCLGQYSTTGEYTSFIAPVNVFRLGNCLRDEDGIVWAVMDEYNDWVSPVLKKLGLKSRMRVEASPNDQK